MIGNAAADFKLYFLATDAKIEASVFSKVSIIIPSPLSNTFAIKLLL